MSGTVLLFKSALMHPCMQRISEAYIMLQAHGTCILDTVGMTGSMMQLLSPVQPLCPLLESVNISTSMDHIYTSAASYINHLMEQAVYTDKRHASVSKASYCSWLMTQTPSRHDKY